jgi:hypothetical protein
MLIDPLDRSSSSIMSCSCCHDCVTKRDSPYGRWLPSTLRACRDIVIAVDEPLHRGPEITPKFLTPDISGIRKFGFGYWVTLFYPISLLQIVKKEVNQGQRKQITALIMHVIIRDPRRTPVPNEQSSRH